MTRIDRVTPLIKCAAKAFYSVWVKSEGSPEFQVIILREMNELGFKTITGHRVLVHLDPSGRLEKELREMLKELDNKPQSDNKNTA